LIQKHIVLIQQVNAPFKERNSVVQKQQTNITLNHEKVVLKHFFSTAVKSTVQHFNKINIYMLVSGINFCSKKRRRNTTVNHHN